MSDLPWSARAYATETPSGEIAGSVSTPASSVICWNAGVVTAGDESGEKKRPAKNAAATRTAAPVNHATGARRSPSDVGAATVATRPLEVDEPDTACSANARSRADWNRS